MPRTARYYQAANAAQGISAGSGGGLSSSDPAAFSISAYIASLNSGYDVYLNRGGIVQPPTSTETISSWNLITSAPADLGRVLLWDGLGNSGLGKDPFTFDAGVYDPPTLTGDAGGWTSIGSGRWTKNFTFASDPQLRAIYAQAQLGQQLAVPRLELCKRSSQANCTDVGDWFVSGTTTSTVTICTGSDVAVEGSPSRAFGGLALVGGQSRWSGALWFSDAQRLDWLDPVIALHGGIRMRPQSGTGLIADIRMVEPQSRYYVRNSFMIDSPAMTSDTAGVRRIRLVRPKLRSDTRSEASQKDWASLANGHGVQHAISIYGQAGEVSIVDPELQGGRHALVEVQGDTSLTNASNDNWPRNIEVYGTSQGSARAIMPGDSLGYYRWLAVASNGGVRIENFEVTGQTTQSQISGRCRIARNLMHQFVAPNLSRNSPDDNGGFDGAMSFGNNGSGTLLVRPADVQVEHNVIVNPWGYAVRVGFAWDDIFPAGALKFRFNTVIDLDHFNERKVIGQTTSGKTWETLTPGGNGAIKILSSSNPEGVYVSAQDFQHNIFITPSTSILVDGTRTGSHGNGPGVQVSGNTVNGTFFNAYVGAGNQQAASLSAAGLGADYRPQSGSAALGAAADKTPRLDFSSTVRPIPASVGALEMA